MNEQMRHEIVRRRQGGASLRRIAKDLGLARDTVQSVVRRWEAERAGHDAPGPVPVPNRRPSLLDPFNPDFRRAKRDDNSACVAAIFPRFSATIVTSFFLFSGFFLRLNPRAGNAPRSCGTRLAE